MSNMCIVYIRDVIERATRTHTIIGRHCDTTQLSHTVSSNESSNLSKYASTAEISNRSGIILSLDYQSSLLADQIAFRRRRCYHMYDRCSRTTATTIDAVDATTRDSTTLHR